MVRKNRARYSFPNPSKSGRNTVCTRALKNHLRYTHAIVNPFSADARGVKLPDDDSARSVGIQLKWAVSANSTSGGFVGVAFKPDLSAMRVKASTLDADEVSTWQSSDTSPDYTSLSTTFSKYRIISWGIRIIPLVAPTDQSGYIRVITSHQDPSGSTPYPTAGGFHDEVHDYPVANSDVHWVSKPVGNTFKNYIDIGDTASWQYVTVVGAGWPASYTSAVRIEVVYNVEAQMEFGQITGALSTRAANHQPRIMAAVDHTRNMIANSVSTSTENFTKGIWDTAKRGIVSAGESFGLNLMGKALTSLIAPELTVGEEVASLLGPAVSEVVEWVD
jgi:hypothetical protein